MVQSITWLHIHNYFPSSIHLPIDYKHGTKLHSNGHLWDELAKNLRLFIYVENIDYYTCITLKRIVNSLRSGISYNITYRQIGLGLNWCTLISLTYYRISTYIHILPLTQQYCLVFKYILVVVVPNILGIALNDFKIIHAVTANRACKSSQNKLSPVSKWLPYVSDKHNYETQYGFDPPHQTQRST